MLRKAENLNLQLANRTRNRRKLHSIHGLLRGRVIDGQFEVRGQHYRFSFVPATTALAGGKLVLRGRMVVHSPQLSTRFVDSVEPSSSQFRVVSACRPCAGSCSPEPHRQAKRLRRGRKRSRRKGRRLTSNPGYIPLEARGLMSLVDLWSSQPDP